MDSVKDFTREEYQDIEKRALALRDVFVNDCWKRALLRLAEAADCLDAMVARTHDTEQPEDQMKR